MSIPEYFGDLLDRLNRPFTLKENETTSEIKSANLLDIIEKSCTFLSEESKPVNLEASKETNEAVRVHHIATKSSGTKVRIF